jgi:hypothetical protein
MNELTTQFEFNFDDENFGSLTRLYQEAVAQGVTEKSKPSEWARHQGKTFIAEVAKNLNTDIVRIINTKKGKGGGTTAVWQIVVEYARYLSPKLAMRINEVAMALELGDPRIIEAWSKNASAVDMARAQFTLANKGFNKEIQTIGDAHGVTIEGMQYGQAMNAIYRPILGCTAKQHKAKHNVPDRVSIPDVLTQDELATATFAQALAAKTLRNQQRINGFGHVIAVVEGSAIKAARLMAEA